MTDFTYIPKHDLYLQRSDTGDGGWSLHTLEQIEEGRTHGEPADYLLSGPADRLETDYYHEVKSWDRPNAADYAEAIRIASEAAQ